MGKKFHSSAVARLAGVRPGEGHPIEVVRTQQIGTDGKTNVVLGVNLATAPVPDRKYVANAYQVLLKDGSTMILFGQERIDGKGLRSLLVIHMGGEAVMHFLESLPTGEPGKPTFEESAANAGVSAASPMIMKEEPSQTIALKANAIYAAFSGPDACMDFYQVSPAAIHASKLSNAVGADAVVRVDLRTADLLGLCDELKKIREQLATTKFTGSTS